MHESHKYGPAVDASLVLLPCSSNILYQWYCFSPEHALQVFSFALLLLECAVGNAYYVFKHYRSKGRKAYAMARNMYR